MSELEDGNCEDRFDPTPEGSDYEWELMRHRFLSSMSDAAGDARIDAREDPTAVTPPASQSAPLASAERRSPVTPPTEARDVATTTRSMRRRQRPVRSARAASVAANKEDHAHVEAAARATAAIGAHAAEIAKVVLSDLEQKLGQPTQDMGIHSDNVVAQGTSGHGRKQLVVPSKRSKRRSTESQHDKPVTTVMMCNIPCRIMQDELIEAVDALGFAGKYDFLYLPSGVKSSLAGGPNRGYSFVNLKDPTDVDSFITAFTGFRFQGTQSDKLCTVKIAQTQGRDENLRQFKRSVTKLKSLPGAPFFAHDSTSSAASPASQVSATPSR